VQTSSTWPSSFIATSLAQSIIDGTVFAAPAVQRQDISADLDATTAHDCLHAFRLAWGTQAPHVFVATNPMFTVTRAAIAEALNASRTQPVTPIKEFNLADFGYTDLGAPGVRVRENHVEDLDIWQAEFANHVRVNFKPTAFESDTVQLVVRVGNGRVSQPDWKAGLDLLAQQLVLRGGVGRHPFEELQDLLGSRSIQLGFQVDDDALSFSGRCPRAEVELCLRAIAAYLTDAAYRESAMNEILAAFGSMYSSLANSPGGPITMFSRRILSGGDRRTGIAAGTELAERKPAEVIAWIAPQFKNGPIELGIAGDTTWEEVASAAASTLGALPDRITTGIKTSQMLRLPTKPERKPYIFTTSPQLKQVALAWYCPVPDLADAHQERRCRLLAQLVAERLRVRVREELGAAYAFTADFAQSDGFPNLNAFTVYTEVSPQHAERANALIREAIDSLYRKQFTDDEFARARAPFIRQREDDRRNNGYWAYTVLRDAQQRPVRLDAARDRLSDTAAMTRADLEILARRYFKVSRWFQMVAYPQATGGAASRH
jgi:zinc protease